MTARPRVVVTRGPIDESFHEIGFSVVRADGRALASAGDVDRPIYMRSSAKPLIGAVIVESGAAEHFGFDDRDLAVICASHSGEDAHVAAVRAIFQKIGVSEKALRCGVHPPVNQRAADELFKRGQLPEQIHNNCSGKHAGIIALGMHLGASPEGYLEVGHPAEVRILGGCAELLGVGREALVVGTDGCGIPVIAVSMLAASRCYAKFGAPEAFGQRWQPAVERIRAAMTRHPYLVAGTKRFDTDLMQAAGGAILCKGGAEGYHATAVLNQSIGLAVKVSDGNHRAVGPFVVEELLALGAIDERVAAELAAHRRPVVRNHAGTHVGEISAEI